MPFMKKNTYSYAFPRFLRSIKSLLSWYIRLSMFNLFTMKHSFEAIQAMGMSENHFALQIINLIEQRSGLLLHEEHRRVDAFRAIAAAVRDLGLRDAEALYYQLHLYDVQHSTWQMVLKPLTIGETYFFRNQAHFNALRGLILPQIIEQKRERNDRWIRIWSAGCSTGEEIYSLAILLRELLPDYKDWSLYLIGTDINETYLEQARQGLYRINSFRTETPEALREDWFTKQGSSYKLDASIRNMVVFQPLNLVTDVFPTVNATLQLMDIILCQNVTIYFDRPTTERIQTNLIETLAPEGWLVLGHSEPLYIKSPSIKLRNFPNAVVFQRQPTWTEQKPVTPFPDVPLSKTPSPIASVKWPQTTKLTQDADQAAEIFQAAQSAADQQQWDEALALLSQLLPVYQLHGYPYYLRALIYMEKSEDQKALAALRQAIYCNPNFILAHYTLGDLYTRMKYTVQAKHEWQLTQSLLAGLPLNSLVPYSTDLTVEMLSELLRMHLGGSENEK